MIKITLTHEDMCKFGHSLIDEYHLDTAGKEDKYAVDIMKACIRENFDQAYVVQWVNEFGNYYQFWQIVFPNDEGYLMFRLKYPSVKSKVVFSDESPEQH